MRRVIRDILGSVLVGLLSACSHELQIKNLAMYQTPFHIGADAGRPRVAVLPFDGTTDDLFFFNAIVERLSADPGIADLRTDYLARIEQARADQPFVPDLVLTIRPKVAYRSSGWNFLVNWPGFLIFTPAWNGYVYHADLMTTFVINDRDGKALDQLDVPMTLNLRHADANRSTWAEISWFEVSVIAFCSGIYFANNFDREVIPGFQTHIKDTYTNYTMAQAQKRIRSMGAAALASRAPPRAAATEAASGSNHGTCFAVSPNGVLLTAHHVIRGAQQVRIKLPDHDWEEAQISDVSTLNDVAVLRIKSPTPEFVSLAPPKHSAVGQRVFTVGYPASDILGTEPKFSDGTISALSGPGNERNFLQVSVPIQPGSSGGPLLTESGEVVGIITASASVLPFLQNTGALPQNVNWAINIDFARPLLDVPGAARHLAREEAIARARASACLVEAIPGAP